MIIAEGLCKTFRHGKKTVEAVIDVSLRVGRGEIYGFLGPNGAGKTTTMRMLTTLLEPTCGTVQIVGYNLRRDAREIRAKIGYVSQKGGCYEMATGFENLVLQGRLYGLTRQAAEAKAKDLIRILDMGEYAGRKVTTFSGGQRRHIDMGMGIMHNPELLFLDEPTTGLDPASRAAFWEQIQTLRSMGLTIFLTTHYLEEADSLCDTICIMDRGKVAAEGSSLELKRRIAGDIIEFGLERRDLKRAEELIQGHGGIREIQVSDKTLKLYVNEGERVLPEILPLLVGAGIPIQTVQMKRPSLDEVFLKTTGYALEAKKEDAG